VSAVEVIFLAPGLSLEETAQHIADALSFEVRHDEQGVYLVRAEPGGNGDRLVGELHANYLAPEPEPEPPHTIDRYPVMWRLHRKAVPDWHRQRDAARAVFDELVDKLSWSALLTHDAQLAIADWSPEGGLREFPENTSVDDERVEPLFH
jgi:hypothetical protein